MEIAEMHSKEVKRTNFRPLIAYAGASLIITLANGALIHRMRPDRGVLSPRHGIAEMSTLLGVFTIGLQVIYAHQVDIRNGHLDLRRGVTFLRRQVGLIFTIVIGLVIWTKELDSGVMNSGRFIGAITFALASKIAIAPWQANRLASRHWLRLTCSLFVVLSIRFLLWGMGFGRTTDTLLFADGIATLGSVVVLLGYSRSRNQPTQEWTSETRISLWIGVGAVAGLALLSSSGFTGFTLAPASQNLFVEAARPIFIAALLVTYLLTPELVSQSVNSLDTRKWFRRTYLVATLCSTVVWLSSALVSETLRNIILGTSNSVTTGSQLITGIGYFALSLTVVPLILHAYHSSWLSLSVWTPVVLLGTVNTVGSFERNRVAIWVGVLVAYALYLNVVTFAHTSTPVTARRYMQNQAKLSSGAWVSSISIVIPSYNPGPKIAAHVEETFRVCREVSDNVQVVVVSDGSTDESCDILSEISTKGFSHLPLTHNQGKGAALRAGLQETHGELVGFIDADGDIHPEIIKTLVQALSTDQADIAFASKSHAASSVEVSIARKLTSAGFQILMRLLFNLTVKDTQTGAKMFRRQTIREVLPVLKEDGFSFDLEVFIAAAQLGYTKFVEVPVQINRTGGSSVNPRRVIQTFYETLRVFVRGRLLLEYETTSDAIE